MACGRLEAEGPRPCHCPVCAAQTPVCSEARVGEEQIGVPKLLKGLTSKPGAVLRWLAR